MTTGAHRLRLRRRGLRRRDAQRLAAYPPDAWPARRAVALQVADACASACRHGSARVGRHGQRCSVPSDRRLRCASALTSPGLTVVGIVIAISAAAVATALCTLASRRRQQAKFVEGAAVLVHQAAATCNSEHIIVVWRNTYAALACQRLVYVACVPVLLIWTGSLTSRHSFGARSEH